MTIGSRPRHVWALADAPRHARIGVNLLTRPRTVMVPRANARRPGGRPGLRDASLDTGTGISKKSDHAVSASEVVWRVATERQSSPGRRRDFSFHVRANSTTLHRSAPAAAPELLVRRLTSPPSIFRTARLTARCAEPCSSTPVTSSPVCPLELRCGVPGLLRLLRLATSCGGLSSTFCAVPRGTAEVEHARRRDVRDCG